MQSEQNRSQTARRPNQIVLRAVVNSILFLEDIAWSSHCLCFLSRMLSLTLWMHIEWYGGIERLTRTSNESMRRRVLWGLRDSAGSMTDKLQCLI